MKGLPILTIVLAVLLAGCQNTNSPDYTVKMFTKHMKALEFEKAKHYVTPQTIASLKLVEAMYKLGDSVAVRHAVSSIVFDGEDSERTCSFLNDGGQTVTVPVTLVEGTDRWLIDVPPGYVLGT
ncbi:MAG TPA: hypothetical protein VEY71_04305, partial [Chitinophagales bacterium]|nr:hypothetical protein [Chitinophagales bacterium]